MASLPLRSKSSKPSTASAQTDNTQTTANQAIHIVENADVCLTSTLSPSAKLFVSSEVLARSSPVFEKLVRPSPGEQLDIVRTVNVPDICIDTMHSLCLLLHKTRKLRELHITPDFDAAAGAVEIALAAKAYDVVGISKTIFLQHCLPLSKNLARQAQRAASMTRNLRPWDSPKMRCWRQRHICSSKRKCSPSTQDAW
jgi:hypothetical protein